MRLYRRAICERSFASTDVERQLEARRSGIAEKRVLSGGESPKKSRVW